MTEILKLKTAYEWCIIENVCPAKLSEWPTTKSFYMQDFFEEKISYAEFFERTKKIKLKFGVVPQKPQLFLNYRMYGLVAYNLSPIQQGIQFGHAVVEYGIKTKDNPSYEDIYNKWAHKDKTFIILNGGTTNENPRHYGTLQMYCNYLKDLGVFLAEFREPDLNDTLTSFVFLVDERVFNRELYPDLSDEATDEQKTEWENNVIGGHINAELRKFLSALKLA
jgi:hypothetical protein